VKTGIQRALIYLDARFHGHEHNEIRGQFSDSLLEAFTETFYREVCGAPLKSVFLLPARRIREKER
jgi:hypothetical protein